MAASMSSPVCLFVCMYVCVCLYIYVCVCMYVCMYTCICACMCIVYTTEDTRFMVIVTQAAVTLTISVYCVVERHAIYSNTYNTLQAHMTTSGQ